MKYAVIGSRDFSNKQLFLQHMNAIVQPDDEIVSGGARGPDRWSIEWAKEHGVKYIEYLPDWDLYGKRAGFLRNKSIAINCDAVLAFWDGTSKGTRHTIQLAHELGRYILVVFPSGKTKERKRIG